MKYIEYQKKYADGVAELWNKSTKNWPEGLGSKLEKNAQDIEKELSLGGYLKIILALSEDNKVVGYCDLKSSPIFKEVCYIETLNVHPNYQGLGIGRQLLKRIIKFSIINGYNRIDAFTWPSNIKAISLYKRMGFFWQPNTSVQMVNFIPKLFNYYFLPRNLLKKWDTLLQVKPTPGPDKFQIDGRLYYPYLFTDEQNLIEIRIDKISQCIFYYKTSSAFFTISTTDLTLHGDAREVEINTRGFRIDNAKLCCHKKEFAIDITRNIIIIPSKIQMPNEESILKIFAQRGMRKFEFGIGFCRQEKIEPLDKNQFISASIPQVGFRKVIEHSAPLICKVIVSKVMRKAVSYQIRGGNELFTIDISNIVRLLLPGIHKIKFIFKEKSKNGKIITIIKRYLIVDNTENILQAKVGKDMLIWLKDCCCFIKNPGAKLVIRSHNLIDRGIVFAHYDQISNSRKKLETKEFTFQCNNKNDKAIVRAATKELTKVYIFANPGDVVVNYKSLKPLTLLSTAYFMDESALLKIGAKKGPITMIQKDVENRIKQNNGFQLLTYSHRIACSLNEKSTNEFDFASQRIIYKISLQSKKIIAPTAWQIKERRKELISSSYKIQELIENVKLVRFLKNNFICATRSLSLAVDPSFGLGIHSLKFNNKEILLTDYPKVGQLGEDWPWYGGLYTLGCLANPEVIDSFKELCLEEKNEMHSIISYHNGKNIPGVFIKTNMDRVSGLKTAYLITYYFLLPYELIMVSKFENENHVPMPCYFSSIAYIKPLPDMLLISDAFRSKIMPNEEHLEIPAKRIIKFRSQKNELIIRYLLYSNLGSNLKVINLANRKGFNLVLDIKDYFEPTNFIVQHFQFKGE